MWGVWFGSESHSWFLLQNHWGTHCRPLLCHDSWKKNHLMEEILHHLIGIVNPPSIHKVCTFLFIPAGAGFLPPQQSQISTSQQILSGWWFQPTWKILVKLDHFPNFRGKNQKCLKPPSFQWYTPYHGNPQLSLILRGVIQVPQSMGNDPTQILPP